LDEPGIGSNFQPFVRRRDVTHNDDAALTREPEMVKAYRDTWELGLHSYLTYLRDRLALCRDLLAPSGSVFVQIGEANLHHVREVMDELFGVDNFCGCVTFRTTSAVSSPMARVNVLGAVADYLLWYCKDFERVKYRQLYLAKGLASDTSGVYSWVESPDRRTRRRMTPEELSGECAIPAGWRVFCLDNMTSQGFSQGLSQQYVLDGGVGREAVGYM